MGVSAYPQHAQRGAHPYLAQPFNIVSLNQVWKTDLTYGYTEEGWLYVAALKDQLNGDIVSDAMGPR